MADVHERVAEIMCRLFVTLESTASPGHHVGQRHSRLLENLRSPNLGQASGESDGLAKFTRNARKTIHTKDPSTTDHRIKSRCTYARYNKS